MGQNCPLVAGAAISAFKLAVASEMTTKGIAKYYQNMLLHAMKKAIHKKFHDRKHPPIDLAKAMQASTFRDFDDAVTAPLHGFNDAGEYYQKSSSCYYISGIRKPTLVVSALDDPLSTEAIPARSEFSDSTTVEITLVVVILALVAISWPCRVLA